MSDLYVQTFSYAGPSTVAVCMNEKHLLPTLHSMILNHQFSEENLGAVSVGHVLYNLVTCADTHVPQNGAHLTHGARLDELLEILDGKRTTNHEAAPVALIPTYVGMSTGHYLIIRWEGWEKGSGWRVEVHDINDQNKPLMVTRDLFEDLSGPAAHWTWQRFWNVFVGKDWEALEGEITRIKMSHLPPGAGSW